MSYLVNLCKSIDQFCNTIIGGNLDVTISGHIGHKANADIRWQWISDVVDYTFNPIESSHCFNSWLQDDDIDNTDNLMATTLVALIGCIILFIPIRLISLIDRR